RQAVLAAWSRPWRPPRRRSRVCWRQRRSPQGRAQTALELPRRGGGDGNPAGGRREGVGGPGGHGAAGREAARAASRGRDLPEAERAAPGAGPERAGETSHAPMNPTGSADFFYMPRDFISGKSRGQAFANFVSEEAASKFQRAWHGRLTCAGLPVGAPGVDISVATVQGLAANLARAENPRMRRVRNPEYRPFVLDGADHAVCRR
ncbi:unnamed protein product, partial [Prorocentrum cordatum]